MSGYSFSGERHEDYSGHHRSWTEHVAVPDEIVRRIQADAVVHEVDCEKCAGNGEIVTDWPLYMHGRDGVSADDEATEDCPDCDGTGRLAAPAPSCAPGRTASQCSAQETELAVLLAEVELELRHSRVFIGSREKMHPTGIELYEQLHAKVNAALNALR